MTEAPAEPRARTFVLVVDDSPDTLKLLTDALDEAGYTVLVAEDGPAALALVGRVTPDVVLLDAVMPGMDGAETCRALKSLREMASVPVIFMTGLRGTEDIVRGLEAGGVDYVTKPVSPAEIIARVRVHLANARLMRSTRSALDVTGRFLLAVDRDGAVSWGTPQAMRLLAGPDAEAPARLPPPACAWLLGRAPPVGETFRLEQRPGAAPLDLVYVGRLGASEVLLRLVEHRPGGEEGRIRERLAVTAREAEVLLWVARGKQNRDIADILGLSPRTVTKHLEQIYAKLGVENRASAAALAIHALANPVD